MADIDIQDKQIHQLDPNPNEYEQVRVPSQRRLSGSSWKSEYLVFEQFAAAIAPLLGITAGIDAAIEQHIIDTPHGSSFPDDEDVGDLVLLFNQNLI
jgi:hypothetical protein